MNMTALLAILSSDLQDLCRQGMSCSNFPSKLQHFFQSHNVVMSFESDKAVCFSLESDNSEGSEDFGSLWCLQILCYVVTSLAGIFVAIVQLVKLARCTSSGSAVPVQQGEF